MSTIPDIIVLGGGPAGYVAAIKAAQLGAVVTLIEKDTLGGTCLNRGCIPTKTYLHNAEIIDNIKEASTHGITIADDSLTIDIQQIVGEKNKVVKKLTDGVAYLLKANKIKVIKSSGVLQKSGKILLDDGTLLNAEKIILAGGSKVGKFPLPGIDLPNVITSDEILDLAEIPEHLTIVGGGVVGVEMAQIFNAYGSQVTIIEMMPTLLPMMDKDISDLIRKELEANRIRVLTEEAVAEITQTPDGLSVNLKSSEKIPADKVLISIGRKIDDSSLSDSPLKPVKGVVQVDDFLQTELPNIYAIGDITGKKMLAHAAYKMGEVAAENAVHGNKKRIDLSSIPAVVYTNPEIATVGFSEKELKEQGKEYNKGVFNLSSNGRALASGAGKGFIKVLTDKKYNSILGIHMIGLHVSEIINEAAMLQAMEITAEEIIEVMPSHPSVSEALTEAVAATISKAIHLPPK